eukprot:512024-Amorphochlora_amoeboformis.AAC.2
MRGCCNGPERDLEKRNGVNTYVLANTRLEGRAAVRGTPYELDVIVDERKTRQRLFLTKTGTTTNTSAYIIRKLLVNVGFGSVRFGYHPELKIVGLRVGEGLGAT